MEERRKFMRFSTSVDVKYKSPERAIEGSSLSRDFSREGIGFTGNRGIPSGTHLELEINIPGEIAPIFATGEVAWVKESSKGGEFDIGVKLVKMDSFDRSRLLEYAYNKWLKARSKAV